MSIVPKRNYNGVLYQFSPPKNKVTPVVSCLKQAISIELVFVCIEMNLFKKELAVVAIVMITGMFGPSMYLASNFQEYNGKAAARRAAE